MLEGHGIEVQFYGARGNDEAGETLLHIVAQTPLNTQAYLVFEGITPFTRVFSDPTYDNGHGERTFINGRGVADYFLPGHLPKDFFDADIVAFGGTALVPGLHDNLSLLCERAHDHGAIVVVNTVYDFRSERDNPGRRWYLGKENEAFPFIDLLITDKEEALKTERFFDN